MSGKLSHFKKNKNYHSEISKLPNGIKETPKGDWPLHNF